MRRAFASGERSSSNQLIPTNSKPRTNKIPIVHLAAIRNTRQIPLIFSPGLSTPTSSISAFTAAYNTPHEHRIPMEASRRARGARERIGHQHAPNAGHEPRRGDHERARRRGEALGG